jgi:hypothetical protein
MKSPIYFIHHIISIRKYVPHLKWVVPPGNAPRLDRLNWIASPRPPQLDRFASTTSTGSLRLDRLNWIASPRPPRLVGAGEDEEWSGDACVALRPVHLLASFPPPILGDASVPTLLHTAPAPTSLAHL